MLCCECVCDVLHCCVNVFVFHTMFDAATLLWLQLGIYDRMKNELLDTEASDSGNNLLQCLQQSSALSLRVCDEESGAPRGYESLMATLGLTVSLVFVCERVV